MFAAAVVALRQRLGMTQEELADRAGLGVRTIRYLESGRAGRPRPATVRGLADALGLQGDQRAQFVIDAAASPVAAEPAGAAIVPPAQLPADISGFSGRGREIQRLNDLLTKLGHTAPVPVVVSGAAGVGKSALVVHWAHQASHRFPDGQLYLNLRGFAPSEPMPPAHALSYMLTSLGFSAEQVPPDLDAAAAMYRSVIARRRMLIVLDNALDPAQVRTLLPPGRRNFTLITSRTRLGGLAALEGAQRIALEPLPALEATLLLGRLVGGRRLRSLRRVTPALIDACGRIPLALRIAAANLSDPGLDPNAYVEQLTASRLSALRVVGDDQSAVDAAFSFSYQRLGPAARRLFRLIGVDPGADITAAAAAALVGLPIDETRDLLETLNDAHLLERRGDRYTSHDLIRLCAAETARREEPEPARQAALQRLLGHYQSRVDAAAQLLYPHLLRLPNMATQPAIPFDDAPEALAWLDAEHLNLVAVVTHAAQHGPRPAAWSLAHSLRGYFTNRMHTTSWQTTANAALAAAQHDGNPYAHTSAQLNLGVLRWHQGDHDQATRHFQLALADARRAGWADGEAATLANWSSQCSEQGNFDAAISQLHEALTLNQRTGRVAAQATVLANLGLTHLMMGRFHKAVTNLEDALRIQETLGFSAIKATSLTNLGLAYHLLGHTEQATARLAAARDLHHQNGNLAGEAETLAVLAMIHSAADDNHHAVDLASEAIEIVQRSGHRTYQAAVALNALTEAYHRIGDHKQALKTRLEAYETATQSEERYLTITTLIGLASDRRHLGQLTEAITDIQEALAQARKSGWRHLQAYALSTLAAIHHDLGDVDQAIRAASQADAIHAETGYRLQLSSADFRIRHIRWTTSAALSPTKEKLALRDLILDAGDMLAPVTHAAMTPTPQPERVVDLAIAAVAVAAADPHHEGWIRQAIADTFVEFDHDRYAAIPKRQTPPRKDFHAMMMPPGISRVVEMLVAINPHLRRTLDTPIRPPDPPDLGSSIQRHAIAPDETDKIDKLTTATHAR
ncbi:ATP-binding protein [Allorhizocola rhizosphaerae]|uniref:ATP-binding protein n=1 Tax=Allorhizocola rhizosphaerae TaxID=1872709 RepID=UPI0013C2DA75|nr:tetratricopeptide repeat protein [Allorhizocola rhizosphaerae]